MSLDKEKLQYWALIAEIFGGIAVLVTLVLLVIWVRENANAIKAATYDSLVADMGNWRMQNATNESLLEANFVQSVEGIDALSPKQAYQRRDAFISLFFIYERAFVQWEAGNLDDASWQRFNIAMCRTSSARFEEEVGSFLDGVTTEAFAEYRHSQCDVARRTE